MELITRLNVSLEKCFDARLRVAEDVNICLKFKGSIQLKNSSSSESSGGETLTSFHRNVCEGMSISM